MAQFGSCVRACVLACVGVCESVDEHVRVCVCACVRVRLCVRGRECVRMRLLIESASSATEEPTEQADVGFATLDVAHRGRAEHRAKKKRVANRLKLMARK
jgi:hypothetical protein